jgi:hypothetical protein
MGIFRAKYFIDEFEDKYWLLQYYKKPKYKWKSFWKLLRIEEVMTKYVDKKAWKNVEMEYDITKYLKKEVIGKYIGLKYNDTSGYVFFDVPYSENYRGDVLVKETLRELSCYFPTSASFENYIRQTELLFREDNEKYKDKLNFEKQHFVYYDK